ncbi:type II secretion system F family protein [Marilutibacter spongiae]|uniref:Type II secretion system F family protein n=1 Tax=Marilutibacter spongiae TaxID=2025720 RepID=A0A7W3Y7B0_9GAMM|nr:type II secretion system F family protein [Lysobacter spongiae]MBB1061994.1 type II secretion system F family protein [Lysobacter spongiae]
MSGQVILIALTAFAAIALGGLYAIRAGDAFMARYHQAFMEQARVNLADMFLFIDPRQLYLTNVVVLIVVPLLLWAITGKLFLALIAAVLLAVMPKKIYRWLRQRRINKIQEQLPDALMMLSGTMKAGLGFSPALESLVKDGYPPLAQELALVLREQHLGVKTEVALERFAERVPVLDVKLFVSAVSISREVGGNLAESLKVLADTLRRRLIMENKVKALTAQGKLQGIVMAMLPVAITAYLATAYPTTMEPMFNTWTGYAVIGVCAILEYIGYKMCVKIMTIDI